MSPLAHSVAVALVALLAAVSTLAEPKSCHSDSKGIETNFPVQLLTAYVEVGVRDASVTTLDGCSQYGRRLLGIKVTVCDDVDPDVTVRSLLTTEVHRNGLLRVRAPVYVMEYCDDSREAARNLRE